jgi:hypothetical protein
MCLCAKCVPGSAELKRLRMGCAGHQGQPPFVCLYRRSHLACLLSLVETSCTPLHPVLDQIRPHELDYPSVIVAVR